MFMRGDYGKDRDPPFLMLGCGRGFLQRDDPTASLQAARNRKEEAIFITGNGDRAWDIYATCIYHNRRKGRRMSQISLPIDRTYIDQERRALRSNNIVDKN